MFTVTRSKNEPITVKFVTYYALTFRKDCLELRDILHYMLILFLVLFINVVLFILFDLFRKNNFWKVTGITKNKIPFDQKSKIKVFK